MNPTILETIIEALPRYLIATDNPGTTIESYRVTNERTGQVVQIQASEWDGSPHICSVCTEPDGHTLYSPCAACENPSWGPLATDPDDAVDQIEAATA